MIVWEKILRLLRLAWLPIQINIVFAGFMYLLGTVCVLCVTDWNKGGPAYEWWWAELLAERLIGRQKESVPTTFVGKTIGQVWSTFGIFIGAIGLIFCLAGCGLLNLTFTVSGDHPDAHLYINLTSIISLCFGIASTITGFILKNRVVQICGFIAGLGGFFCALQYPWAEQLYVMAAVSVVGLIVPGFVIYFQNHQ